MENKIPKVSVIIPNYNYGRYIREAIASVQAQTLEDIEIIVIDDCSSDDSVSIVESMKAQDSRIQLIRNEINLGAGETRNRGLDFATGEYIKFLDSDDTMGPEVLEKMYDAAVEKNVSIVCGRVVMVSEKGEITKLHEQDCSHLDGMILTPEDADKNDASFIFDDVLIADSLYRRDLFEGVRFPNLKWEDLPVIPILKFLKGKKILYLDFDVYNYRQTPISTTKTDTTFKTVRIMDIIRGMDILRASMPEQYKQRIDAWEFGHVTTRIFDILQWRDCSQMHKSILISALWNCMICDCDNIFYNPFVEKDNPRLALINDINRQRSALREGNEREDTTGRTLDEVILELSKYRDVKPSNIKIADSKKSINFIDYFSQRLRALQEGGDEIYIGDSSSSRDAVVFGVCKDFELFSYDMLKEKNLAIEKKDMLNLMAEAMILAIPDVEVLIARPGFHVIAQYLDFEILGMTKKDCLLRAESVTTSREFQKRSMVAAAIMAMRNVSPNLLRDVPSRSEMIKE